MESYEIKKMPDEEFMPLWQKHAKQMFKQEQIYRPIHLLNEDDKKQFLELRTHTGKPLQLNYGVFHKDEFVGWSWGYQETAECFYMCNSAILPAHRRKGLYTQLMNKITEEVLDLGFQRIYSRHNLTNNNVLIPKLKAGFVITSIEVSDVFGSLVHLTLFKNKIRNKVLDYRVGLIKPDKEISNLLEFDSSN